MSKLTLEGDKELVKQLNELDKKIAKKIANKALRAGAKVVAKEIKQIAPVGTGPGDHGAIPSSVKVRSGKRSRTRISVEAQIGAGAFKGDQYYAAFVDLGTSKQPPQHYMDKAKENVGDIAMAVVETEMARGIAEAI